MLNTNLYFAHTNQSIIYYFPPCLKTFVLLSLLSAIFSSFAQDENDSSVVMVPEAEFTLALPSPAELSNYPSQVGSGSQGWFGEYNNRFNVADTPIYIPRCVPPAGSRVKDFDTDITSYVPSVISSPELRYVSQKVESAIVPTISPNNYLDISSSYREEHYQVIEFDIPQKFIGMYMGASSAGVSIELLALNTAREVVARDLIVTQDASVTTCMAMQSPNGSDIVHLVVRSSADTFGDRLFYSDTLDLPSAPIPVRGEVVFLSPIDGASVSTRSRALVTGTVTVPLGQRIDDVSVTSLNWNRSANTIKSASVSKLRDTAEHSVFMFIANGLYLPRGRSDIVISATGPGAIATGLINVIGEGKPPLQADGIAGKIDVEPVNLEVSQAVRGNVPLITPGSHRDMADDAILVRDKPTVVRGFARLTVLEGETFNRSTPIYAELIGSRNGTSLPGSPLSARNITANIRRWNDREQSYHANKQVDGSSWVFSLPDSWTVEGEIDLRLVVNPTRSNYHIPEHPSKSDADNIIGVNKVKFRDQPLPKIVVWLVDYYFRCAEFGDDGARMRKNSAVYGLAVDPNTLCSGSAAGDIVNHKPNVFQAAESVMTWWNMAPLPKSFPDFFEYYDYVFVAAEDPEIPESAVTTPFLSAGSPANTDTLGVAFRSDVVVGTDGYGIINFLMSDFIRGKGWLSPSFFRTTTSLTTTIHEAGHTMGLRHTGNGHGEAFWIKRWGDDRGQVAKTERDISMFDVLRMTALSYDNRHDFMSYGPNRWASLDVWHQMEDVVGSNMVLVDSRVDDHMGVFFTDLLGLDGAPGEEEMVTISGHFVDGQLQLAYGYNKPGAVLTKSGDLRFTVVDRKNNKTYQTQSQMLFASDATSEDSLDDMSFIAGIYVPTGLPIDATELVIEYQGKPIYQGAIQAIVKRTMLNSNFAMDASGSMTVNWEPEIIQAVAAEKIRYLLQVSQDGESWFDVATTQETFVNLDTKKLAFAGKNWIMRVQASTGIANSISNIVTVDFPEKPPLIPQIVYPRPGAQFSENTFINLFAANSRFRRGGQELEWLVNGQLVGLGTSAIFIAPAAGDIRVELRSPISGVTATTEITAFKDSDLDGMPNEWENKWQLDPFDPTDKTLDQDQDSLTALDEFLHQTSPLSKDSDGDSFSDFTEVQANTDPINPNSFPDKQGQNSIPDDQSKNQQILDIDWRYLLGVFLLLGFIFLLFQKRK